jgi:hypothetical protein
MTKTLRRASSGSGVPALIAFLIWLGFFSFGTVPASAARVTTLTWTIDTAKLAGGAGAPFVFPLPINGLGQKVTGLSVTGATRTEPMRIPRLNSLLRIYPSENIVTVHVTVRNDGEGLPHLSDYQPANDTLAIPASLAPFLKVTCGLDQTTPAITALARSLRGENNLATVRNVLRYVHQNIKYNYLYWRSVDEVLSHKTGQCEGQSALATALLRRLGIPTRMMFIFYPNKPRGNVIDGHTIVQFYLSGCGWFMGDPGNGDRIFPSTRILLGEEPIPYYYCRQGMGALLQPGETLEQNYPQMWDYLNQARNVYENTVASCMTDFFKIMYDCKVDSDFKAN